MALLRLLVVLSLMSMSLPLLARAIPERREEQGPGPSGYLLDPIDGAIWDNTYGWGLGHVRYQGVSTAYHNGDITHVKTSSIDIYLEDMNQTTIYYLARGINPDANTLVVDEYFALPYTNGSYYLTINETQECQSVDLPPIIFKAAAPTVIVQTNETSDPPARRSMSTRLSARNEPSGTLNEPGNGYIWDNTSGFGSGHVQYQGVNSSYYSGDVTEVTTHTIDIWLEIDDTSEPYYLARGIALKNLTLDVDFQIPAFMNGTYSLVVNETQECQSPELPPIILRTAAPVISILPSTVVESSSSGNAPTINIGALAGGIVGGVAILVILGLMIFLVWRRNRKQADENTPRFTRERSGLVTPLPFEQDYLATPFDLSAALGQPPEYTQTATTPAVVTPSGKSRFSNTSSRPEGTRTSSGSSATVLLSHGRSDSRGSSTSHFERDNSSPLSRQPSTLDVTIGHSPVFGRSDLVAMDPQASSRYPTAGIAPMREKRADFQPVRVPALVRIPSRPGLPTSAEARGRLRSPIGPRPMTYHPGDLVTRQSLRGHIQGTSDDK